MKTAILKAFVLGPALAILVLAQHQNAQAQRMASAPVDAFFDEVGIMIGDAFVPVPEATEQQLAGNPPLFENHSEEHLPLLMPDGTTPITYNQFGSLTGTATVLDVGDEGTRVTMTLDNLIPGGTYTVWTDYFEAPGFTPDFAHELAAGALGYDTSNPPANPNDYVGNVIKRGVQ